MIKTGAQIVIECLLEQGVDTVFGYPGGAILNVYDELYKYSDKITHYLTSHEQGASHSADGYARATGKVGVVMATSGPGATNLVTGLATAYMDSVPVVAITCNVGCSLLGKDSFQEVDISGITMPITKHNYIVKDVNKLADTIREAFYIANSGRKGPVLIDIPKDVTAQKCEYKYKEPEEILPATEYKESEIKKAISLIKKSKRPYVLAGGGVISSGASEQLAEFVNKVNAPIGNTLMGISSYPVSEKLFTGLVGMHGTKASNFAMTKCDLLVAVGCRFSDRVLSNVKTFIRDKKIIHIDVDPAEIDKNVPSTTSLIGDAKLILETLNANIEQKSNDEWVETVLEWKKHFPHQEPVTAEALTPEYIMKSIGDKAKEDIIITTEVGQNQMWAAQYYDYVNPRTFITSGGLGTMGFGTGASMGAQIGCPDKRVVCISGDGSFRMNLNELSTIREYNIPVIIIIMNNQTLGMVRQWQTLFYKQRYSQTTLDTRGPDFKKLADAYSIKGFVVKTKEEFESAIKDALSEREPVLIDAKIDMNEFVLPMVAPGKNIDDIIFEVEK